MKRSIRILTALLILPAVAGLLQLGPFTSPSQVAADGTDNPRSGWGSWDFDKVDPDNDGCTTQEEWGTDPATGGARDPASFWDFFDTPPRDNHINIIDIGRVVARFGAVEGSPDYYPSFDRSAPPAGSGIWASGPPDGQVNILDVGLMIAQFGHACREIEWCNGYVIAEPDQEYHADFSVYPGERIRDCYTIFDEQGRAVDYLIHEAEAEDAAEELSEEQVAEMGLTMPTHDEAKAIAEATGQDWETMELLPWYRWTCIGSAWYRSIFNQTLMKIRVVRSYVTTPYGNIVWRPPNAEISVPKTNSGWRLASNGLRLWTYPISYFRYPDIVAVGETHGQGRFELRAFGLTIQTRTLHLYVKFKAGVPGPGPRPPELHPCHFSGRPH